MVRARHSHPPTGRWIIAPFVLTRGKHPGKRSGDADGAKEDDRM
jgi:hypothetical protein